MQRGRRALVIGAMAILAIAVAGAIYLRPPANRLVAATPRPSPLHFQRIGDAYSYAFQSATTGWAVEASFSPSVISGSFWIWRTLDGAKHWQMRLTGDSGATFVTVDSAQFLDANNAFVASGDPLVLRRTSDGGSHWTTRVLPTQDVLQIDFTDVHHGWLVSRSLTAPATSTGARLYMTTDGGDSWSLLPDPPIDLSSVAFRTSSVGWAGGAGAGMPYIYATADTGRTWVKQALPTPPNWGAAEFSAFVELVPKLGAVGIVGFQTSSYETTSFDLGHTWTLVFPPVTLPEGEFPNIAYLSSTQWWAVAGSVLYKTSSGGQRWARITAALPPNLFLLKVLDAQHAWAQYNNLAGTGLTYTSDGGVHWTPTNVPRSPV